MRITDLKVWLTMPEVPGRTLVFLQVDTDEGVSGIGEATSSGGGGSLVVGSMVRLLRDGMLTHDFRESLIGEDPDDIDRIWHKLYRRFTGGGGHGGFVTTLLSGIDIALWDIKGKAAQKPIYRLFGGPIWDRVILYNHVAPGDPRKAAEQAKSLVAQGYTALKTDPFMPEMRQHHRRYTRGSISAAGAANGVDTIAAIRDAVGPDVEVMIDAHGNFNVPTAIDLARRLEPYHITWFEEPVQPDSNEAPSTRQGVGQRADLRGGAALHPLRLRAHTHTAAGRIYNARHCLDRRHQRATQDSQHGRGLLRSRSVPTTPAGRSTSWPGRTR